MTQPQPVPPYFHPNLAFESSADCHTIRRSANDVTRCEGIGLPGAKMDSIITADRGSALLSRPKIWEDYLNLPTLRHHITWLSYCLLALVLLNFVLLGWIVSSLQLSQDSRPLRHMPGGKPQMEMQSTLQVDQTLYTNSIEPVPVEPAASNSDNRLHVQSDTSQITFAHIDPTSGLESSIRLAENGIEVKTSKLTIQSNDHSKPRTKLEISANELILDYDHNQMRASIGGLRVTQLLNTSSVRSQGDRDFRIESRNENVKLNSHEQIEVESMSGPVAVNSLDSIEVNAEQLSLDSRNVHMGHLKMWQNLHRHRTSDQVSEAEEPTAYQLCVCANGELFAANVDSSCETDSQFCARQI